MKQEGTNTFNDGLYMDYNPISTPNTVLTDNLNGTFITYDGNELMLQNDMGNYQLKDCQLKPNYIPIGMKEYGNILYIVSYNPLDKHVEIGSFPSPEVKVHLKEEKNQEKENDNIIIDGFQEYTNIIKSSQPVMWYEEKLKLYPGDQYLINVSDIPSSPYVFNKWYIIDDDKNTLEITDKIHIGPSNINNDDSYWKVNWECPGYLYTKQEVLSPTEFNAVISAIILPNWVADDKNFNITASDIDIRFSLVFKKVDLQQITWLKDYARDGDLINLTKLGLTKFVNFNIDVTVDNLVDDQNPNTNVEWELDYIKIVDYSDSEYYISGVLSMINRDDNIISGLNIKNVLNFTITPKVLNPIYENEKPGGIIYNQFAAKLSQSLNSIGKLEDIDTGSSLYKFWREDNILKIEYNVDGPVVVNTRNKLFYKVWPINRYTVPNCTPIQDWTEIDDYFGIGQNVTRINLNNTNLNPEEAYIITFGFGESASNIDKNFETNPKFNRILITSVVFQSFISKRDVFDHEISFNEWFSLHDEYFKSCEANLTFDLSNCSIGSVLKTSKQSNNEKFFSATTEDAILYKYPTTISDGDKIPEATYYLGYDVYNAKCNVNVTKSEIGLWKSGLNSVKCKYKDNVINLTNSSNGTYVGTQNLTATVCQSINVKTERLGTASIPNVDKVFCNNNLSINVTGYDGADSGSYENAQLIGSILSTTHNWQINNVWEHIIPPAINEGFVIGVSKIFGDVAVSVSHHTKLQIVGYWALESISAGIIIPSLAATITFVLPIATIVISILSIFGKGDAMINWIKKTINQFLKWAGKILLQVGSWITKTGSDKNTTTTTKLYVANKSSSINFCKLDTHIDSDDNISIVVNEDPDYREIDQSSFACVFEEYLTNAQGNDYYDSNFGKWIQSLLNSGNATWSKDAFRYDRRNNFMMTGYNSVKLTGNYTSFPVLWTGYKGKGTNKSKCVFGSKNKQFEVESDYTTCHTVWIAFFTNQTTNNVIYVPCMFNGTGKYEGYIQNTDGNGFVKHINGQDDWDTACHVSENIIIGEVTMMIAAMLWNSGLFTIPKEGKLENRSFYCPVTDGLKLNKDLSIPYDILISLIYGQFMYYGVDISHFTRLHGYDITTDKVSYIDILNGNTETIENIEIKLSGSHRITDDIILSHFENKKNEIEEGVNKIVNEIFDLIKTCLVIYHNASEDPVIKENAIRKGNLKGVYNIYQPYSSGGLLDALESNNAHLENSLKLSIVDENTKAFVKHPGNNACGLNIGMASNYEIDLSKAISEAENAVSPNGEPIDIKNLWKP